jgi:hypothetical protein
VQALLPLLATYLGHARYTDTAYYVTGTAELLAWQPTARLPMEASYERPSIARDAVGILLP